jgi:transposase
MEAPLNLTTASRAELLAIIARQQAVIMQQEAMLAQQQTVITQLQQRVTALEEQLRKKGGGTGMPGTKPTSTRPPERKEARKARSEGFARARMTPTQQVDHAVETCPDCGIPLQGGWVQRTREVVDLPLVAVEVVEHRFLARTCPQCRKRWVARPEFGGMVAGKQRLGTEVVSLIATLRLVGRLPIRTIQWLLATVYQLELSVGGITTVLHDVARRAKPAVAAIREQVRASPVVHADETGWREEGVNGYVWTFSTPRERYFVRRGRDKGVVDEVLGPAFQGVLVTDFYAAYNHYPGLHQRCWAHLLREIHSLRQLYPDDAELARWAMAVHGLFERGKAVAGDDLRQRQRAQQQLSRELLAVCRPFLDDPVAVQRRLCKRIERFLAELLTFVADPAVPADNNPAERSLRHLVTCRKISGGTRSARGSTTAMTLASLFGTWTARGVNPLIACRQLLTSPQL